MHDGSHQLVLSAPWGNLSPAPLSQRPRPAPTLLSPDSQGHPDGHRSASHVGDPSDSDSAHMPLAGAQPLRMRPLLPVPAPGTFQLPLCLGGGLEGFGAFVSFSGLLSGGCEMIPY